MSNKRTLKQLEESEAWKVWHARVAREQRDDAREKLALVTEMLTRERVFCNRALNNEREFLVHILHRLESLESLWKRQRRKKRVRK